MCLVLGNRADTKKEKEVDAMTAQSNETFFLTHRGTRQHVCSEIIINVLKDLLYTEKKNRLSIFAAVLV